MEKCPICRSPATAEQRQIGAFVFNCLRCGEFTISADADDVLRNVPLEPSQIGATSGYIRNNEGLIIRERDIATLRGVRIPTVEEKAARLLLALAREYPQPGMWIPDPAPRIVATVNALATHANEKVFPDDAVPDYATFLKWLSISAANDAGELRWLMKKVLAEHQFLDSTGHKEVFDHKGYSLLLLTARGWAEVERMRSANRESNFAFVAMSFRDDFKDLYLHSIEPGIKAAGFEALRVDQKEHNNRIDDEIIASIRTSRFLVADFSVDRGGIYFEAGYALGFGLPVIWLVQESAKDSIHFDNRQYNFIRWNSDDYAALRAALRNRIEATIGRGPARRS
jgi:nucleoside 2-deoxyribosyltransferase